VLGQSMGISYVVSVLEVGKLHSASAPADNKQALSVRVGLSCCY